MTCRLELHPDARSDAREAMHWYDKQVPGLGRLVLVELDRVLDRIQRFPEAYPRFRGGLRQAALARFPYHAFYVHSNDTVTLIAVMHIRIERQAVEQRLAQRLLRDS